MFLPVDATVNELLKEMGSAWNEDLIRSIFWDEEARAILSIPLGKLTRDDKLIWALIENDNFSIKSAYFAIMNQRGENKGASSNPKNQINKWK